VHAIERLSLRSVAADDMAGTQDGQELRYLQLLTDDAGMDASGRSGKKSSREANDLAQLLIRLRLGSPELARRGKWTGE
jgi:hypothetical protein